jgi:hypothetical protein
MGNLALPLVHQHWGDGDWSEHLERMLYWLRKRETERTGEGGGNAASPPNDGLGRAAE